MGKESKLDRPIAARTVRMVRMLSRLMGTPQTGDLGRRWRCLRVRRPCIQYNGVGGYVCVYYC